MAIDEQQDWHHQDVQQVRHGPQRRTPDDARNLAPGLQVALKPSGSLTQQASRRYQTLLVHSDVATISGLPAGADQP